MTIDNFHYLITKHGFVICFEESSVKQKEIGDVNSLDDLICLRSDLGVFSLQKGGKNIFFLDADFSCSNKATSISNIDIKFHDREVVSININNMFLSARPDMTIGYEHACKDWEKFRVVTHKNMEKIIRIFKSEIVINRELFKVKTRDCNVNHLNFGNFFINISDIFNNYDGISNEFLFFDEWSPCVARILNPLIIYIVYGDGDILDQFKMSIRSLYKFGKYKYKICIVTNLNSEVFEQILKEYKLDWFIVDSTATDTADFVYSRISILSSDFVKSFSPILYVDCDIIFNRPIEEFLIEFSSSDKISAQVENGKYVQTSISNGKSLFLNKPFACNGNLPGFNAGILMVPCGYKFNIFFRYAYNAMQIYTSKNGRDSIPFYDQSLLNYILYKFSIFSGSIMNEKIRVSAQDISKYTGFVHFWTHGSKRSQAMYDYIKYLEKHED